MSVFRGEPRARAVFLRGNEPPHWRGKKHASQEVVWTARGTYLMTPHLLMRPLSSTTILPALWSSMYSNSLM